MAKKYNFESPDFALTYPSQVMNENDRQFYEDNGYILVKKLVSDDLLNECIQRFVNICDGIVPAHGLLLMKDISLARSGARGEYLYNKIQDFAYDNVLSKYMFCPQILSYVECFTGPDITAIHSMLINKPPDAGTLSSRHPVHQDLYYFPYRPANRIVASWTAMEHVTKENGCLFVIPGSHKKQLYPHNYPDWNGAVNKAYHGILNYECDNKVEVEMEKGDTIFFHPLLLHGSGPNLTKGFRKAISVHYASSNCEIIDIRDSIQSTIISEVENVFKSKGLDDLDYNTYWKLKSRLVKGLKSNL